MNGVELIHAERLRQQNVEGWDAQHDDAHIDDELVMAAICYAANKNGLDGRVVVVLDDRYDFPGEEVGLEPYWPQRGDWPEWDKRKKDDRIRSLVKAGALIAAEIDRLQRLEAATKPPEKLGGGDNDYG